MEKVLFKFRKILAWILIFVTVSGYMPIRGLEVFAQSSDFVIEDGVLVEYRGTGGDVIVPEGVTCIGYGAFASCYSLSSIMLPEGVTKIEGWGFSNCTSLSSVTLPESLTAIEEYAFYNCTNLSSITLPDVLTSIGQYAFSECTGLNSITLPRGLTKIGYRVFLKCTNLKSVIFPENLNSIEAGAFSECTSLSSITLPEGLTSIGNNAFDACTNLNIIELPKSLISIGDGTFASTGINSITLPKGLTDIGSSAFGGCRSLSSIKLPQNLISIGDFAFRECMNLSSITLPEGLTYIGNFAFSECTGISSVTLPKGLKSMGTHIFYRCRSLNSVTLPEDLVSIEGEMFKECTSLSNILLPESVTSIEVGAFEDCTSLESILLPEGLKSIGGRAFSGCTGLSSILLPESLKSIGGQAFSECTGLGSITLPENLTSIEGGMFSGCTSLSSIQLPESVTRIGSSAFKRCTSLSSIELPESVTSIGGEAFWECTSLSSMLLPKGITSIENRVFFQCTNLSSIELPESVTRIEERAFFGCTSLSSIRIPKGVTSIEEGTFEETSLSSAILPEGVIEIKDFAFYACNNLSNISIPSSVTNIGMYVFSDNHTNLVIHGIEGSYAQTFANEMGIPFSIESNSPSNSNGIVGSDEWSIAVINTAGNIISDAAVTLNNVTMTTDASGYAVFPYEFNLKEVYPLKVEKEGYYTYDSEICDNLKKVNIIVLHPTSDNPLDLASVRLTEGGYFSTAYTDLLQKSWGVKLDDGNFSLKARTLNGNQNVREFQFKQNGKIIAVSSDGVFNGLKPSELSDGQGFTMTVVGNDGQTTTALLRITAYAYAAESVPEGGVAINFGEGIKLQLPEDIPFLGKHELKLKLDSFIGKIEVNENERTVKVAIGAKDDIKLEEKDAWKDFKLVCESASQIGIRDAVKKGKFRFSNLIEVDSSAVGYLEGNLGEDGKIDVLSGGIVIELEGSVGNDFQLPVAFPLYAGFEFSIGSKFKNELIYNFEKQQLAGKLELNPSAKLLLSGGLGIANVASVGLYGSGELEGNIDMMQEPSLKTLDLNGELGLNAKVWIFEHKGVIFSGKMNLYPGEKNRTIQNQQPSLYNTKEYQIADRTYLDSRSQWQGENSANTYRLTEESGSVRTLQSSAYTNIHPLIAQCGDKTLMFYLDDMAERSAGNHTALVYSVYNSANDSWSQPIPVEDDGTLDAAPSVATDGTNLYITWQNMNQTFDENVTMEQMAQAAEISVAKWNGNGFDKAWKLTDNDVLDSQPTIALKDGNPTIFYAVNTQNDIFGTSSTNNICSRTLTENGWEAEQVLQSDVSSITSLTAGVLDGTLYSACVLDADNDLNTIQDRDIYLLTLDGIAQRLTQDEVLDSNPCFGQINGVNTLHWYRENNIAFVQSAAGEITTLLPQAVSNLTDQYQIINQGDTSTLLYTSADEKAESGSEVWTVSYDASSGSWSSPYTLTEQEDYIVSPNGFYTDGSLKLVYNQTKAEITETEVKETSEFCDATIVPQTELTLTKVICEPKDVKPGAKLPMDLMLKNSGQKRVDAVRAAVLDPSGEEVYSQDFAETLQPGEEKTIVMEAELPQTLAEGEYEILISTQDDADADNNSQKVKLVYPDLSIDTESLLVNGEENYLVTVSNQGALSTVGKVIITNQENQTELCSYSLDTLEPGQSVTLRLKATEICKETANAMTAAFTAQSEREEYYLSNNTSQEEIAGTSEVEETYLVTFDTDGGSKVTEQRREAGSKISKPAEPAKDGYLFEGWYTSSNKKWDFENDVMPAENITLYAHWKKKEQTPPDNSGEPEKPNNPGEQEKPNNPDKEHPADKPEAELPPQKNPENPFIPVEPEETGQWMQDAAGWWYQRDDSSYPVNQWERINGIWYAFDEFGYMRTGWYLEGDTWYYLSENGAMQTGWLNDGSAWYYCSENGKMQTGWLNDGYAWYYCNESGAMQTGWLNDGMAWYYLSGNGAMQTGWLNDGTAWYYLSGNGAMQLGWLNDRTVWYYLSDNGAMQTGWLNDGTAWYYLSGNGEMQTGWLNDGGTWYYLSESGEMQTGWLNDRTTWYYLYLDGKMAAGTTIGNYAVDMNGVWIE